jgi:hypothetical protein
MSAATEAPLKLIQLQITTPSRIWERCLVQQYVPAQEDVDFYYKQLLNFADATITISVQKIPSDFNAALLPNHESAPSDFPANDLESAPDETERREKYKQFITQLCEMERSRAALKALQRSKSEAKPKYTHAVSDEAPFLVGFASKHQGASERRAWVQEVLRELDAEEDVPEDNVLVAEDEAPPHGWIVVPSVSSARAALGARLLVDPAIGRKWERLLGSDTFPDLLVVRRINTKGWSFEGTLSDKLLEHTLQWFISSQDLSVTNGMTEFCHGLEKEFCKILFTLRSVKVGERLLDMEDDSNPRVRVHKLINLLESQCLESADTNPEIQAVSESVFHRYLSYAFRAAKIPREIYALDEKIPAILERWSKSNYGFKDNTDPIIPEWKEQWDYVMRGKPSAIRVNHFLASMDAWDPVACSVITNVERSSIAQEWMKIYMDTQLIKNESGKIKSVILYDQVRKWCLRFLPETVFSSCFASSIIGPVLTKRGLQSVKVRNGRFIHGVKFRQLIGKTEDCGGEMAATEEEIRTATADGEKITEANTVQYTTVSRENDDGTQTKQRTVEATLVAEKDGTRIEHFFTASVTTETIHLGDI